jgi:hypothetical protein
VWYAPCYLMVMRSLLICTLTCAALAQIEPALAETLRCGSALIEPGDDAAYVLKNCGQPNSTDPISGPALTPEFSLNPGAIFRAARWRYDRGIGKFPAVVVIGDDGRVEDIQLDKHRD